MSKDIGAFNEISNELETMKTGLDVTETRLNDMIALLKSRIEMDQNQFEEKTIQERFDETMESMQEYSNQKKKLSVFKEKVEIVKEKMKE